MFRVTGASVASLLIFADVQRLCRKRHIPIVLQGIHRTLQSGQKSVRGRLFEHGRLPKVRLQANLPCMSCKTGL